MAAPLKNVLFTANHIFSLRLVHFSTATHQIRRFLPTTCTACAVQQSMLMSSSQTSVGSPKAQKISQAMKAYIEKAKVHKKFMEEATADYEIGKRHLANIMGEDPDSFTQEDIDKAIEYLLPSGLFDKKARPQMKHPNEFVPSKAAAQFSVTGRPVHTMFYTGQPEFYKLMFDAAVKLDTLKKLDDDNFKKRKPQPEEIFLSGSEWISKTQLEKILNEKLKDTDFTKFIRIMERVSAEPYARAAEDFIFRFRNRIDTQAMLKDIKPLAFDEDGRPYQEAQGERKSSRAHVVVYGKGKGSVTINGLDLIAYFPQIIDRQQLLFPLHFVDLLGKVDIVAEVKFGGCSSQAGAVRHGISLALQSFVNKETLNKMRLAGLLTRDPRRAERKKPGQEKARKKFTWKKR